MNILDAIFSIFVAVFYTMIWLALRGIMSHIIFVLLILVICYSLWKVTVRTKYKLKQKTAQYFIETAERQLALEKSGTIYIHPDRETMKQNDSMADKDR